MNEIQRQAYLSALGIENYMPRWQLPQAPLAQACVMPVVASPAAVALERDSSFAQSPAQLGVDHPVAHQPQSSAPQWPGAPLASSSQSQAPTQVSNLLAEMVTPKKAPLSASAATILQQLEVPKVPVVAPFALSLWRPAPGFLIVDSRDTSLALPTELLLGNLLRVVLGSGFQPAEEEVMRWPMVENRFVSRTADDARVELQTWLAVEHELRPIQRLWLMGDNAARYLLPVDTDLPAHWFQQQPLAAGNLRALLLPSLNQLLQQPQLKARLWAALHV